ncbi:hypothetical protein ACVDHI_01880 [Aeromonas sp. 25-248]
MKNNNFIDILYSKDFAEVFNVILRDPEDKGWIHVENERDKAFWIDVLGTDIIQRYQFTMSSGIDVVDDGARGKARFYSHLEKANIKHVFAIDSDLSHFTPDLANVNLTIISNKYVLHTYGYGKESIINSAENLNACLNIYRKTCENTLSYIEFLETYSNIIYKPLLAYIFSLSLPPRERISSKDFYAAIKINPTAFFKEDKWQSTIKRINEFNTNNDFSEHNDFIGFMKTASSFGLMKNNAYQFIDCHFLENSVINPVDRLIRKGLISKNIEMYKKIIKDGTAIKEKMADITNHFERNICLDTLRHTLSSYRENMLFQLMEKQKDHLMTLH